MSSPPSNRELEGLIADNWDETAVTPAVVAALEPYRESVEAMADDYDEENQSWRDYRRAVWSTVPELVMEWIERHHEPPRPADVIGEVSAEAEDESRVEVTVTVASVIRKNGKTRGWSHSVGVIAEDDTIPSWLTAATLARRLAKKAIKIMSENTIEIRSSESDARIGEET